MSCPFPTLFVLLAPALQAPTCAVHPEHGAGGTASSHGELAAPRSDDPAALARVATNVVPALFELAEWCNEQKLLASRLLCYEAVLTLDPDHADARRILGWSRDKNGAWKRSRPESQKRDRGGMATELAARAESVVQRVRAACSAEGEAFERVHGRAVRLALVPLVPDHADLRADLGQAESAPGVWLRADVVRAVAREAERLEAVRLAKEAHIGPETVAASSLPEGALTAGLKWTGVLRVQNAIVTGTVSAAELRNVAIALDLAPWVAEIALPPPAEAVLDDEGEPPLGDTRDDMPEWYRVPRFFVLGAAGDRENLVRTLSKDLSPATIAILRRSACGFFDEENSIGAWNATPADRLEASVRQRVGLYLQRTFDIGPDRGWIWEGIGLLLSSSVTGTRNIVYVQLTEGTVAGGKAGKPQLLGPKADWLKMARDLLRATPRVNLVPLLGKNVNAMTKDDLLVAYALGSWIVDGHPEVAPRILARIGAGHAQATVLAEELGIELPEVVAELAAWLEEMRRDP